jgi:two-component system, NtrC family, sensor kinase
MSPPAPVDESSWSKRRLYRIFAASIVMMYGLDVLILERLSLPPLVIRVVWAMELVLFSELMLRAPARWHRMLSTLDAMLISGLFLGILTSMGGADSPYFHLLPTLTMLLGFIKPQSSMPALAGGAISMVGAIMLMLQKSEPISQVVASAFMVGTTTLLGMYCATQLRKTEAAENETRLERARREALEKLAMAERQRGQMEKLATVGRLAAGVAHEINNPLAFVRSNLEFLRQEVARWSAPEESRAEVDEVFEETRSGVERIQQIAADLKGYSRMDAGEGSECALVDVVTDAAKLAALRLKHVARLRVEVPRELPEVYATRPRLAQVILNLLVNAGDALEEAQVKGAEVWVRGSVEGSQVVLRVEDNGPGFPPEVLERLFEAFFTTKGPEKGTGLGLAISRELVERFGGTLTAENRAEGGARLLLRLPVRSSSGGVPTSQQPPPSPG